MLSEDGGKCNEKYEKLRILFILMFLVSVGDVSGVGLSVLFQNNCIGMLRSSF